MHNVHILRESRRGDQQLALLSISYFMKFLTQPIEREGQTSATPKTHTHTHKLTQMEQGLVAEMWWSLVVIGVCSVLIRVCHEVWLKPRRIKSMLWRQGIRGPQPSFPYGNISEMQKIQFSMINNTSDGQPVSENWTHSLFPYLQQWRQEYGIYASILYDFSFQHIQKFMVCL